MSNIGKKPIIVGENVTVDTVNNVVKVTGPKGSLEMDLPKEIELNIVDGKIVVKKIADRSELDKYLGLTRSILANMIMGVNQEFSKKLELVGVGYRAKIDGRDLVLNVGFAHPVRVKPIEGVSFSVGESIITVSGINKELVGNEASKIRAIRPPDAYKGKGIRYHKEIVRKKAGKSVKAAGAAK